MAITSTLAYSGSAGATSLNGIQSTGSGTLNIDVAVTIPASTTNQLYTVAVDVSTVQSLILNSSGTITFKTNSSGSPVQTLTFTANNPLIWNTGMPVVCPLTTDITAIYLTNATLVDITLTGFIMQNL